VQGDPRDRDQILAQAQDRRLCLDEAEQPADRVAPHVVVQPLRQVGQQQLHDPVGADDLVKPQPRVGDLGGQVLRAVEVGGGEPGDVAGKG
jgi:hypothetical protein